LARADVAADEPFHLSIEAIFEIRAKLVRVGTPVCRHLTYPLGWSEGIVSFKTDADHESGTGRPCSASTLLD
jgi:hypothetical protein